MPSRMFPRLSPRSRKATHAGSGGLLLGDIAHELAAFLLAAECAGCGAFEAFLCASCIRALRPQTVVTYTEQGLAVYAGLPFSGVAARVIRAVKQEGRTSLVRYFAPALHAALGQAAGQHSGMREHPEPPIATRRRAAADHVTSSLLVPIPTSAAAWRRRGYRVPDLLIRATGCSATPLLYPVQRVEDQRHLDRAQRRHNVAGSLRARSPESLGSSVSSSRSVLIVDDVVTTGATVDEAARALREAGHRVHAAVCLAATPRHHDTPQKES